MLSKYSILALIGATNAASGTLPHTSTTSKWPAFSTVVAPTGTSNVSVANDVLVAWIGGSNIGGEIRGFRNNLTVFPNQKLVKAVDATTFMKSEAQTTGYRTFYTTDKTKIGAFPKLATVSDDTTFSVGQTFVVCTKVTTAIECNGGVSIFKGTPTYGAGKERIGYQVNNVALISVGGANQAKAYNMNIDIVMGTMYHSAATAALTDGTIWCSGWSNVLVKAGTAGAFEATNGLTMMSKCTWQLIADDKGYAPGFTLTQLDFTDWEMQVVEWINSAALGTNGVMGEAVDTTSNTGAYAVGTDKNVFINPADPTGSVAGIGTGGTSWKEATYTASKYSDPLAYIPGSVGPAIYYPGKEGPWKDTQLINHDQAVLMDRFSFVSTTYNSYQTSLNEYNSLRTTYNDAATKESERMKDFFKATFDPPVLVPKRPCAPTQPAEYSGTYFDLAATVKDGWESTQAKQKMQASLKTGTDEGKHQDLFHSRIMYLYNSQDASKTATENIGHVWGRLGQGKMNVPANTMPFYFGKEDSGNLAGMNVSAFPSADTTTGLAAAAKKLMFTAKAQAFASYDSFKVATRPGKAEAVSTVLDGAKALIATGLAAATVISTIA